ncbi:MAG: hypothetical protein QNJ30_09185 [Kiloniellales bacterium]|nr:hypothetical protein [Kiloniellales bacterium]
MRRLFCVPACVLVPLAGLVLMGCEVLDSEPAETASATPTSAPGATAVAVAAPAPGPASGDCAARPDKDCVLALALAEVDRTDAEASSQLAALGAAWSKPELLKEAKALAASRPMGTGRAFSIIARRQGELGLAQEAVKTAGKIPWITERSSALAKVVEALAQRGEFQAGLAVAGRIPVSEYKALAVAHVIRLQAEGGEIKLGLGAVQKLSGKGRDHLESRTTAFSWIALSFARLGRTEEALVAARKIRKSDFLAPNLAGVAAVAGRPELFAEAVAVAEKAPSTLRDAALAGIAPRMADAGQLDEALALAKQIEKTSWREAAQAGIVPALARYGRTQEALDLIQEITLPFMRGSAVYGLATVAEDEDLVRQLPFRAHRLGAKTGFEVSKGVAGLLAARGDTAAAARSAKRIAESGRRAEALAALALLSGDRGLLETASADSRGYAPALHNLAEAQACLGAPAEAIETAKREESREARIEALIDVARCLPPEGPYWAEDRQRRELRPDLPPYGFSPWSPQGATFAATE